MKGFVCFVLVLLTVSTTMAVLPCLVDIYQASSSIEKAIVAAIGAAKHCENNTKTCVEFIADIGTYVGAGSGYIASALKDCAGVNNTECPQYVSFVVSDLSGVTAAVTRATSDCASTSTWFACSKDVLWITTGLVSAERDIENAVKQCRKK